jgi:hypothetical protein
MWSSTCNMKITKEKHTKQIGTCKVAVEISWCNCRAPYLVQFLPKEGGFFKRQRSFFLFFFLWENNKFSQGICWVSQKNNQNNKLSQDTLHGITLHSLGITQPPKNSVTFCIQYIRHRLSGVRSPWDCKGPYIFCKVRIRLSSKSDRSSLSRTSAYLSNLQKLFRPSTRPTSLVMGTSNLRRFAPLPYTNNTQKPEQHKTRKRRRRRRA